MNAAPFPSGAGWHQIGAASESILSSLETTPLVIGYAGPTGIDPVAASGFAYGLDRVTTYALLQPGQAFTANPGTLHWYVVHQATDPCVQIWVGR